MSNLPKRASKLGAKEKRRKVRSLLSKFGKLCFYCNVEMIPRKPGQTNICDLAMTIDHVVPLSKGGSNKLENLVLCCNKCNRKKNDSFPSAKEFAKLITTYNQKMVY
jgi:5-methylcytosine-specific restriction endonuclease McrA